MLFVQIGGALLVLSLVVARQQKSPESKTCQINGGYCQTHWECCSGKCLTYNLVCAAKIEPTVAPCQKNWNYCQKNEDCCSANCLPFYNYCSAPNFNPFPFLNPNSLVQIPKLDQTIPRMELVILNTDSGNRSNGSNSGSSSDSNKEKATSLYEVVNNHTERRCHEIGEVCATSDQCCSQRCHFYAHKCVT